jgi:hypothetical protein
MPRVERAVVLADDVSSLAMVAVDIVPAQPKLPSLPPHDGHTHVIIQSNAPELAAAAARRDEARQWEGMMQGAVATHIAHAQAETRSLLARAREADSLRRIDRLGAMAFWDMLPLMRAFRGWALFLELGDAYDAALGSASRMLRGDAEAAAGTLKGAGRSLVQLLIAKPAMLDELSTMRARLHALIQEVGGRPLDLLSWPLPTRDCATLCAAQSPSVSLHLLLLEEVRVRLLDLEPLNLHPTLHACPAALCSPQLPYQRLHALLVKVRGTCQTFTL